MNQNYKKLTILAMVLMISSVCLSAGDCSNPLYTATKFTDAGLTRPRYLTAPAMTSGLEHCTDFNTKESCCDVNTIEDIKSQLKTLKESLQTKSLNRLKGFRGFLMPLIKVKGLPKDKRKEIREGLKTMLKDFQKLIIQGMKDQAVCLDVLLQHQATLLCQGCDPNYATNANFASGQVQLSDAYATSLTAKCQPVVDFYGSIQENLRQAYLVAIDVLSIYVGDDVQGAKKPAKLPTRPEEVQKVPKDQLPLQFAGKDKSTKEELKKSTTGKKIPIPDEAIDGDALFFEFVKGCTTATECKPWFIRHFFKSLLLNVDRILNPSANTDTPVEAQVIAPAPAQAARLLQANLRQLAGETGLNPVTYTTTNAKFDTATSIDGVNGNTDVDTYATSQLDGAIADANASEESALTIQISAFMALFIAFILYM